jgi:hypothetical protein
VKKKKPWAMAAMGQMYGNGHGVKQSYGIAKRLYEQAAQQGNVGAMYSLGVMYDKGKGVEQSYERAIEFYEQAADLSDGHALFNLGCLYANGEGVKQDLTKARELWTKAAAQEFEGASENLKRLDEVEGKSTTFSNTFCSNCETPQTESHKLIQCPCHSVQYCNRECQKKHRKKHKNECRRLLAEQKLTKQTQDSEEGERKEQ